MCARTEVETLVSGDRPPSRFARGFHWLPVRISTSYDLARVSEGADAGVSTSASCPAPASAAASASSSSSISRRLCSPSPAPGAAAEPPPRPCRTGGGIRTVRWPQRPLTAVPSFSAGLRGGPRRGGQRSGACARQVVLPRLSEARGESGDQGSQSCRPRPGPGAGDLEAALLVGVLPGQE